MKRTISYSRISNFVSQYACDMEDYWTYVEGRWPPNNPYFLKGGAVHEAIAANFRHKAQCGEDLPFGKLQQVYEDAWERKLYETVFEDDQDPATLKRQGIEVLEIWHRDLAPTLMPRDPANVERKFFLEVANYSHNLKGVIDLVADVLDADQQLTAGDAVIDFKTGKKSPSQLDLAGDLQPTIYSIEQLNETGRMPPVFYHHLIHTGKTAKVQVSRVDRTQADIDWFSVIFHRVCQQIDAGIWTPVSPGHWKCNAQRCPHWSYCRGKIMKTDKEDSHA
ncbi:MAG: RecB family exonuclease [Acidobacteriota bacterium]